MLSPSFLPDNLKAYDNPSLATDEVLLAKLVELQNDFLVYFETACDDELWMAKHTDFMKGALLWITTQSFQGKSTESFLDRAATAIRKKYLYLERLIPQNFVVKIKGVEHPVNTFLLSTVSTSFKEEFIKCRVKKDKQLIYDALTQQEFRDIYEFACYGMISNLWKRGEKELHEAVNLANRYGVPGIVIQSQEMMKKFVSSENVLEKLALSIDKGWTIVKGRCIEVLNEMDRGFLLSSPSPTRLCVRFDNFNGLTIDHFVPLAKLTTDIACSGEWVDSQGFSRVMALCPHLYGLNLNATPSYSDFYTSIPKGLQALDVSQCSWLKTEYLKKFTVLCPTLESLNLRNNSQLDFSAWGDLLKFKELKTLDISRCQQVKDGDLKIILKACGKLINLNMSECGQVGDEGFYDLARNVPFLSDLNISRTHISDAALVEIAVKCPSLLVLNISKCDNLTEKGVLALVKHANSLEVLNVSQLKFVNSILNAIKRLKPKLEVVYRT